MRENTMKLTKKEALEFVPFTPDMIKDILLKNDEQVKKALLELFAKQTADEQVQETTKYVNMIGFSGADAFILSSFAKQLTERGYLSPKQMDLLRKRIVKYSKQLARIANEKYKLKMQVA